MEKLKLAILLLGGLMLNACALPDKDKTPQAAEKVGDPKSTPQASIEAKQLAAEQEAVAVTELTFAKGKSQLTAEARERLKKMRPQLAEKDRVDKVVVVTWADQEYPSVHAKELPKSARDLAEARGQAIEKFLNTDVEKHNMAERAGAFENFLSTSDARVKKSLEVAGVPNTDTSVKTPAKASKAIVMVIRKN